MPAALQLVIEQIANIGDQELFANDVELRNQLNLLQEQVDWLTEQVIALAQGKNCEAQVVQLESVQEQRGNMPGAVQEQRGNMPGAVQERGVQERAVQEQAIDLMPLEQARIFALLGRGLSNRAILRELGKGGSYNAKVAEARRRYDKQDREGFATAER